MLETIAIYLSWGMLILSIGGLMIKPTWMTFSVFLDFMACAYWSVMSTRNMRYMDETTN